MCSLQILRKLAAKKWHFGGTVSLMNKFVFFWAILAALWPLQLDVRHHIQWRRRLVNAY